MLASALSQILGESADAELAREIKETVNSFPEVRGVYDLVLNNYGPDRFNGSLHIDIPDILEMHALSLKKEEKIARVDFVVSLDAKDRAGVFKEAVGSVEKRFPQYTFYAVMDTDFAEE